MAHYIFQGDAPLASGDELTPSLEYTLDEPNPLHADDYVQRDQPTPSSERDQPTPSSEEKADSPSESPTPEGDNSKTLERQPIYAQVLPRADRPSRDDRPPRDESRTPSTPGDKRTPSTPEEKDLDEVDYADVKSDHSDKEKKDKEDNDDDKSSTGSNDEKPAGVGGNKQGKKNKEKNKDKKNKDGKDKKTKEKVIKVKYRVDTGMPRHRSRCVSCGCARVCCVENFVFCWVILFILLQAGPVAVIVLDFLSIHSHGTTLTRYMEEWRMQPGVCRVTDLQVVDFSSCDCVATDTTCTETISEYGCIQVETELFVYNHTGPISNSTTLWKSDREYVLNKVSPKCFNLDICKIDKNATWSEYREMALRDEMILRNKTGDDDGFVCYYKRVDRDPFTGGGSYVAVMELSTSIWEVILWFFLPLLGVLLCWFIILVCMCWYCCPHGRYITRVKRQPNGGNYHEVVNEGDEPDPDHPGGVHHQHPGAGREAVYFDDGGEHMKTGKWSTSGGACDV